MSPSEFMRRLRPEIYSDTEDRVAYMLDAALLEYHLNTITQRNQTHDFEIFCRKLCERTICPNLRPQSGPEGGGDSKADAETYPVAEEIAALTYIGEPNGGKERWAFAFSAKEKWADKVRHDVEGLVATCRTYDRIICVTSRFARARDRARLEDELFAKYQVPVTIHDRSWIVKEVIENERKDLAVNYLKVGEARTDSFRLGPSDYSRARQLEAIERQIDDPEFFKGMENQRVSEALVAAKLSRNLERPRTETDGRFARAIRFAEADGIYRQKLEAKYEQIWTAFWWYDDVHFVNESYDAFEALALESDHARNIEFLCNLHQLLVNCVVHNLLTRDACQFDKRTENLRQALELLATDKERPNNALEAQASLLILRLGIISANQDHDQLPSLWKEFSEIFDKAEGLGEFDVHRVVKLVEIAGDLAGNDPAYNELIEKMATFVSKRTGEAEGAQILLKRAQKLDFSDNFDMIRLLGKASIMLSKKECAEDQIEALQLLMLAYRSAGLLWAARATCATAAASISIEGEESGSMPVIFVPTMKAWAWIALELRHIPDLLFAIQMLNGSLETLPLDDSSKDRVRDDIRKLDYAFASTLLNLDVPEMKQVEELPDILQAHGLFMAQSALLYILGYEDKLRSDGYIPEPTSGEELHSTFSILANQPVSKGIKRPLALNSERRQVYCTSVVGLTVEIECEGTSHSIQVAEMILGALEAFFATVIEHRVLPHTEKFAIELLEQQEISEPIFTMNDLEHRATLMWPAACSPNSYQHRNIVQESLLVIVSQTLFATCHVSDGLDFLKKQFAEEEVHHRLSIIFAAGSSYHRLTTRGVSRLGDWHVLIKSSYPLRTGRPDLQLNKIEEETPPAEEKNEDAGAHDYSNMTDHRLLRVRSVIDMNAWNKAGWKGTAYIYDPTRPPSIALLFENVEGAKKIFERWHERFGNTDTHDEIYISIVRKLPNESPHHYCIIITSKTPKAEDSNPKQTLLMVSRSLIMTPDNDKNIERFLHAHSRFGAFLLMPALITGTDMPELLPEHAILKRGLVVKLAAEVGEHDPESIALLCHNQRNDGDD